MTTATFALHEEAHAVLNAPIEDAFAYLDDFHKLSSHMERPSGMTMGSSMSIETDRADGKQVGSKVRMAGRAMGILLSLEEVVTEREAPRRKAWETVNTNLIVIGRYRLGFELAPQTGKTALRVYIDYELPRGPARLAGSLFGRMYARWCVTKMASDALRHFNE